MSQSGVAKAVGGQEAAVSAGPSPMSRESYAQALVKDTQEVANGEEAAERAA